MSDSTSFTYDDNGNKTQKTKGNDTWDYTYDYANRLIEIEENESTIGEYIYDGDGKRLQKTENSITTTYIYSGINPIYEENSTGLACYVFGPTGLLVKRTTINQESNTCYYHKDHLGSIRSVTDSGKDIIATSTYHPFGETEVEEGSEHYLFNGKEKDTTDLYYYGVRYYDPQIGRFITRDLIKGNRMNSQSLNRFSYCYNSSLRFIDPEGLEPGTSYHNQDSGVTYTETAEGWIIEFTFEGNSYKLIIRDEVNWTLVDYVGNEIIILENGIVPGYYAGGFIAGFSWPASITLSPISQTIQEMNKIEAFNFALGIGMSENAAKVWAEGYMIGLHIGKIVSQSENVGRYLRIVPSYLNDENWDTLCNNIFEAIVSGYPLVLPVKVPLYVEIIMAVKDFFSI